MESLKQEFLYTKDPIRACDILKEINVDCRNKENGATLLMSTVNCKDAAKVELLLSHGANPEVTNTYGQTALHYGVSMDNYEIVKILLDHGADPNHKDRFGRSILKSAKNEQMRDLLIAKGADPNVPDTEVEQDFWC